MPELILSIEKFEASTSDYNGEEGFIIKTTEQEIKFSIDNFQSCCENFGYFIMQDDPDYFIGAQVLGVSVTDTAYNKEKVPNLNKNEVLFVDIETNKGVLQFTAYNAHNGYYGHTAKIECKQLNVEKSV